MRRSDLLFQHRTRKWFGCGWLSVERSTEVPRHEFAAEDGGGSSIASGAALLRPYPKAMYDCEISHIIRD
jgi:hypothetical protein